MSTREEVLGFIREFEMSAREYLLAKGTSEHEMANAYLELQWKFLHTVLTQHSIPRHRNTAKTGQVLRKSSQATIA